MKSSETKVTNTPQHNFLDIDNKILETNGRISVCPECGNKNIIIDEHTGEYICGRCGIVIEEIFDRGQEWKSFNLDEYERRSRTGSKTTYLIPDKGLSTVIDGTGKNYYGKDLTIEQKRKIQRLRKWDRKIKISKHRSLSIALNTISNVCAKAHLSKVVAEEASVIYRKCLKKGLQRGRTIENIAISSLYYAIRITPDVSMSLKELAEVSNVDKKTIAQGYRVLHRNLKLKVRPQSVLNVLPKIFGRLEKSLGSYSWRRYTYKTSEIFAHYLEKSDMKKVMWGKYPSSVASAVIYISNQLMKDIDHSTTQRHIATAAGVTEVTLRNRYSEIINYLKWDKNDLPRLKDVINIISVYTKQNKMCSYEDIYVNLPKLGAEKLEYYLNELCKLSIVNKIEDSDENFYKLSSELSLFL